MREVELALRRVGRIEWRASDLLLVRVTHDDDASSAMSHTLALVSFFGGVRCNHWMSS
jgi:hypothetical protein